MRYIEFQYSSKQENMEDHELNIALFTRRGVKSEGKLRFKAEEISNFNSSESKL